MKRLSNRTWIGLMLAVCLVVSAATTGLVLSRNSGAVAQAAPAPGTTAPAPPPGSAQARADLTKMQSLLNSGSAAQQDALLAPPLKLASGSGPVVPRGKTITILPGTLRSSGQHGTVRARLSDGTAATLGLYLVGGHWRLYGAQAGTVQTSAATTGQPVTAQLLDARDRINYVPTTKEIGTRTPVIFVHGFGGHGSDWGSTDSRGQPDDPTSMLYKVNQVPGTYVLSFGYDRADTKWVDDPLSGQAFTGYVNRVARASKTAKGPGNVIVVTFSMGGLVTRYAAGNGAAGSIAMVITIGAPNKGSFLSDAHNLICDNPTILPSVAENIQPGFCTQWTAASGMSVFNSRIDQLKMLPSSIPVVHAIAGDQHLVWKMLNATVDAPIGGDGVVPTWSALAKRPGGSQDTFDRVMNPLVPANWSAMHLELQKNVSVMQLVTGYVADWIRKHPPVPVQAAPAAPASGGYDYWLADGGRWYVHGMTLQISRAAATNSEADLTGLWSWNDYQNTVWGHAVLRLSVQQGGSLAGRSPARLRTPSGTGRRQLAMHRSPTPRRTARSSSWCRSRRCTRRSTAATSATPTGARPACRTPAGTAAPSSTVTSVPSCPGTGHSSQFDLLRFIDISTTPTPRSGRQASRSSCGSCEGGHGQPLACATTPAGGARAPATVPSRL